MIWGRTIFVSRLSASGPRSGNRWTVGGGRETSGQWATTITYSVLISYCFALHPYEKHELIKPEWVIVILIRGEGDIQTLSVLWPETGDRWTVAGGRETSGKGGDRYWSGVVNWSGVWVGWGVGISLYRLDISAPSASGLWTVGGGGRENRTSGKWERGPIFQIKEDHG